MHGIDWLLIDIETTGTTQPIFVVEIAAQRMRGWERIGESFHRLINHNKDIPVAASRAHDTRAKF
jgi:DNA polymerase-3 subunit epsilon